MIQYMQARYSINRSRIYVTGAHRPAAGWPRTCWPTTRTSSPAAQSTRPAAQCAASVLAALGCELGTVSRTPAQWGALARAADPGYTGPYPRLAVWQGTADPVVNVTNATNAMEQWTSLWGISQTPSATRTLPGGTTERSYGSPGRPPAVETFLISGMGHALAVDPGPPPRSAAIPGRCSPPVSAPATTRPCSAGLP